MGQFKPEMGQLLFGASAGDYEVSDFVEALIFGIFKEVGRVFWNVNGKSWDYTIIAEWQGIEFRPYYWSRWDVLDENLSEEQKSEYEEDQRLSALPNFKFEDVEIRWYKHPGRSMSVNKVYTEKEWREWFDRCLTTIRGIEKLKTGR